MALLFEESTLEGVACGATRKGLDLRYELVDVLELAVNRDVADVGDGIDLMELVHDLRADRGGGHLAEVILVEVGENFFHGAIEALHGDRAFLAGFDEPAGELFPVERFASAVPLHHAQLRALDLLVGRVAVSAFQALPTTTNRRPVLGGTRVEDFVFEGTALDASHGKNRETMHHSILAYMVWSNQKLRLI